MKAEIAYVKAVDGVDKIAEAKINTYSKGAIRADHHDAITIYDSSTDRCARMAVVICDALKSVD